MTAFNFRSLLLAAIVLSNCITWTASRHHYAHNVHQHRTRHRRQGAGLYLPASYVIPGGEGGGPWGEWGEVSPCSRTCGGGVASQKRICLQPGPEGQCSGGDTKYFSCQTQDCPDGSGDFRAEQCAEFNDKAFRGFKYNWVPYTKAPNPCELNCMPHGERFYFRHKLQVTDGTRCNDESFDVCVNGKCQPVGCDMMLNSTAREDKCRECRGNGANCRTSDGIFDSQDLVKGYNDILLIPAGSTSIYIEEVEPSNNYLALRAKNGTYYLNGHYHIDFPRTIMIAGAPWTYERSQQGFAAPDKLRCLGPTTEPLYLSLLLQDENVGIRYEYSVPKNSAPPTDKQYNWVHEEFTPCSATCGGGFQTRNVTCRSREELEIVDASLCDEGLRPPTNQTCSPDPCPAQWVEGSWGECSQRCGSGGVKSREVTCQKIIANGIKSVVPDKECFDLLGPKPEVFQKCNEDAPCPTWFVGHWKPCDQLCDEGKQTRQVVCYQKKNGRIEVLGDGNCTEAKPEKEQSCMLQPCDGVDWVTSSWSGCDSCTSKNRTRLVVCSTKGRQVLDDSLCSYHKRPKDFEECKEDELPACEVQWYATQWSKCSVNCGDGVQTRKVFCGMYYDDETGIGVEEVEDAKCANLTKYKDTKPCTVPKEECPSQWFAGPWTECSEKCGGGEQYRRVMCFRGDKETTDCDGTTVLDSTQVCNTGPCDPDEMLWSSTTVVLDEKEEYCDDEDYEEVGLDSFTSDDMMSDSPGYAEHESTLETGSGYGSSLSTDDLTTEASGFSTTDTTDSDYTTDDDTGSGETSLTTDVPSSTASKDKDATSTTTVIPPKKTETNGTESTAEETGSTPTSITEDTEATTSSDSTGSTESVVTEETESTPTADTGSTSSDTGSTSSEETTVTEASGPTTAEETGSTESIVTKELASTSESGSTSSGETGSSDTDETGSTTAAETGSTESSISTDDKETGSTSEAGSTSSEETESTDSSSSTDAKYTGSTGETASTSSGASTPTDETGSTDTDETESTASGSTNETGSTDSTVTETTGPTITAETSLTESTVTEETSPTESTITEETGSTESTVTEETGSTESTVTEETGSTESTVTEETGSTESTVTDTTESTVTSDTDSIGTETTNTGSTDAEETSSTGIEDLTSTGSTDSTTTTRAFSTDSTTTTHAVPTESKKEEPTTPSTDSSEATESSTDSSGSTVETSSSSGVESSTDSESTSEAAESSTTSGLDETTESGSTISTESTTESAASSSLGAESSTPSESKSTTAAIESSTSTSESTGAESSTPSGTESTAETMKSGSTDGSESTTESGSSTEESSTVSGEITTQTESTELSTTDSGSSTGTEESTISTYSTTEGTTILGSTEGSTATEMSTTEVSTGTTIWAKSTVFVPAKRICKPRRKPKCNETTFGCCPDQKTPALGPFDEGCKKPHTCTNSTHGCCPDGLSPAQGKNNEGCPVEPCADTLFGCCASDNTTAAQGNDQDGCPPPPPPCVSSKYGCCADNDTEAAGPEKEGCPETETSTTEAVTETTTDTTESIETSEGSTTEGTTDVIGTTTLDPCSGFEFGCCADNETEASGPDGQGCSCNATEFGCCPDGVSPASGLENEGCPGPCSTSPHGCCQDDKTPAHGPDFEGCCLLQAFGCCPDNRKPAEGPHLEGCGCQYALHGCCPDNVTIAQGPDNQGCGCQYTQHGCCPDRHTVATGPNNEGCACNTYQFGCCADGVTTAKGPEQQGCHCRESMFGCCGDGETHATGPNAAGCDCSSSRHGCCPDGRTEATGPKFLGCTDAPENKQAACSMSTDPGPCHNFTAMWYYDLAYGGCSRFWYGGCDGNGNRFATKEECEDVCVQPSPKDACKLPSVKGACDADYQRWHYNSTREQCIPFRYGGCLGNANNFESRDLCQKQCEPSSVADQCNLPIDQGSCAGNFSRWGFDSEARRCEQFIWGGCEGNSNRFSSEAACQMRCAGTQPPKCTQPQEAGNCAEKEALWSFSQSENRCLPFYYSGCGGNDNRFRSRETCEQTCPSAYVPDKCTLPAETGQCSNYRERWFYDTTFKRCRQFYYGGCGGNENNFGTEAECDNSCSEIKTTTTASITTTTTTARPVESQPQTRPNEPEQRPAASERSEFCFNAIDAGPCNNTETRYAYDSALGRCVTFQYGGCGGNQNNFPDDAYCSLYCQPMQDICQLPMLQGPCEDSLMRWFYDPTSDSCSQFTYGGCEGNDNRFESLEACENRCRTGPAPVEPTTPTTTVIVDGPSECRVPEALEDCRYGGKVWYFDPSRHECVSHANQETGPVCRYTGTFSSQEACERSCGAFRGVDVCKQRRDPGPCQSYVTKVYFDPSTGQCHEFIYGGCLGGANRFSSIEECSQVCNAEIADPCTLPPEGGSCFSYVQQWYYDPSRDQCNQFVYTGCSGNENRFETQRDCEARCKRPAATTTTVAPPPQQLAEPECKTPSSLAPCGNNVTVFYYDSERSQCLISGFGGCGHPNTYRTEEECERSCGAFRGMDVCGAHLDPGPCRASFNKIYWDAASGSCQPYAYGGCDGGPNRFSNVEECMSVCGDTGPDPNQVLIQDCTPYHQECEALADCQYGIDRFTQNDGCQRCQCREDPCVSANCQSNERCVAVALRNSATQEPVYSASCVLETNEVDDCDEYEADCLRLRCEYGIQRTRLPDGCDKCSCVQVQIDCEPLKQECDELKCNYGIETIIGSDGCERCQCKENPCDRNSCGAGERCVVQPYVNGLDPEPKYTAECRTIVKAGACPMDETTSNEVTCRRECSDDADCRGVGKCCRRGCSDICLVPVEQTSPHPLLTTAVAPNVPAAPLALPQQEPEVSASEGGTATLRCLFHGNPPPKITWRFGELTIDDNVGRYKLMSDGALEIISLYRNDTGVYICVADNGLGVAMQEIHLVVNDPVRIPVGIAGDENAVVTGELGRPLHVRCLAYGYPPPSVFWYRGYEGVMVPYNDAVYEARGNVLLIRSLAMETLGQYTCQAYNGEGKAASWVVFVRAYMPEGLYIENELLVPRIPAVPRPRTQPPTTAETTTTTTSTTTEAPRPLFTVPVSTHVSTPFSTLNIGADLHLTCEVDGFPEPDVHWTKDGGTLQTDSRITITGSTIVSRLTVTRLSVADSGLYACHASNPYSSQSDTAQINVQQLVVPAKCTDNPFFANCDLIVRSKFCRHKYYSKFCCKSCVEAGQLDPQEAELQADQPLRKK